MIVDQLFDNKKNTNESLADEFMAMARAKGYNPRLRGTPDEERARTDAMLAQRAADRANAPAPAPVSDEERAELEAQLQKLEANFDPDYEFSDDHSFWKQQKSIAQQIGAIKQKLSQGVAEDSDTAEDYRAKAQWLRSELHLSPDEAWERAYDTDPETWVGSPWEDDYKQGMAEGYETTPFGGVTNTTPNYSQAWKVTDEGEEFLRKAYQRLKRAYKEGGQVEMINIGPALSELQQQKFGPAYVQQSGPYQMMTTDISRLIEKIEPWQKQYNQQHIATDFDPEDFSNWNKQQGMSENTGRKVDAKGRTQSEWMQAVKQKFPDARIVQAKMIDGPAHAMLPDGRKFSWTPVQGVTEAIHIDVDLVRAVFYVAKEIYDGAKAGNDMTDTIVDELGDYFDDVEQSGLPKLKRAYAAMRDTADEDPSKQKRAAGDALLRLNTLIRQGMSEAKASTAAFRASNAKRAKLNAMSPEERKEYDKEQAEKQRKRDDARLEKERQKLAAKKGVAENKHNNKRKLDESWLMEDPVYRKFKKVGRYIAERKLTEPEILQIFADAEAGMTDKATGANRTFLGRGKDTATNFAASAADALKGVWSGIQSSVPISAVDTAYDKATDALADVTGGQKGAIMQAIKKYRMLAKEYPKTAGLAKAALVAIAGMATGGAGAPAIAALVYGLDSAVKGEKFSDIALKAGGAAATAWAASKIASMVGGNQPAGADASTFDPSQMPAYDDAGNLMPDFHINPETGQAYYNPNIPSQVGGLTSGGAPVGGGTYTVQSGDQLGYIAQANGSTTQELIKANPNIDFSKPLKIGQELNLPATSGTGTGSVWQGYQGGVYGDNAGLSQTAADAISGRADNLAGMTQQAGGLPPGITPRPQLNIGPGDVRPMGAGAPDTSLLSTPGNFSGTLSGVTADQIYNSPVYQQIYAQEIAKYGAEPSARAIQTAQQIATMKAKAAMAGAVRESTDFTRTVKMRTLSADKLIDQKLTTLSWALNESVGKPQGRSMHLTPLGVYTVFENVRRVAEAAATATRIEPTFEPIDEIPNFMPGYVPPPAPAPTPAPKLSFGSPEDTINRSRRNSATTVPLKPTPAPTPAPAPTTPTGDAAGPGREQLPDLYRPDMADAPTQPADPAKKSWFGKGLDYLDRGAKAVGGALSNFGHQFTTNVTKEKLKMNWHQAGKPSDSDQLSAWLVKQGVPVGVVNGVYEKMGLPVSAEPTTPKADDAKAVEPGASKQPAPANSKASIRMPWVGKNPATGKAWTSAELMALDTGDNAPSATTDAEPKADAGAAAIGNMASQLSTEPAGKTTTPAPVKTSTVSQPTTAGTATTGPAGFNAANVMKLPGMEKYAKKPAAPAKTPNFAGPSGYAKVNQPTTVGYSGLPGTKPAATTAPAPKQTKVVAGGPTPDEQAKLAQRIAQATAKPVAEMLNMVETKEDVAKIKQFVDQTFVKYGAVSESAFAVRNQLIEHITQVGAQRRRDFARKS